MRKSELIDAARQNNVSLGDYARRSIGEIRSQLYREWAGQTVSCIIDGRDETVSVPPAARKAPPSSVNSEASKQSESAQERSKASDMAQAADAAQKAIAALVAASEGNSAKIDPEQIKAIAQSAVAETVRDEITKRMPTVITVENAKIDQSIDLGLSHRSVPDLIKVLNTGLNVWLSGPAGSGKTHAAEQAAKALGLPFYFNGAIDTEYKLTGFIDAQGRCVSTAFRRAFTEGGLYLFDEVDASMPSATLAFQAALSNGYADFPDGMQKKSDRFVAMAAANTWGYGADGNYVGRNRMDAAFTNRFVKFAWDYDEALERQLAGNDEWVSEVQSKRAKALGNGLKVVISPRQSIQGAKLLAAGFSKDQVRNMTYLAGLSDQQRKALA
jgi:hypothetical protein